MKKIILCIVIFLLLVGAYCAWSIFGPIVKEPPGKFLYIKTGATYLDVKRELIRTKILGGTFFFDKIAAQVKYSQNVKPGRYEIKEGSSVINLIRMLKSGSQSPVRLIINKLRTKEDLAGKIGKSFECDSTQVIQFLKSNDSLHQFNLDTNIVMTAVIPNTYLFPWNSDFKKLFRRLKTEEERFWTVDRKQKATKENLSTEQVYTMASIVEEETNKPEDKLLIASTYINRLSKGMRLEADPTVKYALRNFGLKRVLHGHLTYESPYNTYRNPGLPPGPICTPSSKTIDAVLDAPATTYIYFVAKPDLGGYSNFASSYAEHLVFAKAYQKALDSLIIAKQQKAATP